MSSTPSDGLPGAPTGPELGVRLALLDPHAAGDGQLLDLLSAEYRQLAYQQAQVWAVMAELAVRDPSPTLPGNQRWTAEQIFDAAAEEIRAELRLTRRAAQSELVNADAVTALPRVFQALQAGEIDRARAIVLADGCRELTDQQTEVLLDELLPDAGRVTRTWLAEKVARVALALDPDWAEHRYRHAVRDRKVVGYLNSDGSATVSGQNLPADHAALACARVDALADAAKRAGAAATLDHLRAELFLGLLDGRFHGLTQHAITAELQRLYPKPTSRQPADEGARATSDQAADPSAEQASGAATEQRAEQGAEQGADLSAAQGRDTATGRGDRAAAARPGADSTGSQQVEGVGRGVHLRVQLGTLLGVDDQPGEIAGWGAVPAAAARSLAGRQRSAEWRYAILDDTGQLLFVGITGQRPHRHHRRGRRGTDTGNGAGTRAKPMPGGIVELHVPASLLTDRDLPARHPAWAGVLADLAAQYAQQQPISQDPTARFPGRPLRRHTQTLFGRCTFPSCRRPATDSDLDHRHDHARGGATDADNLGPGCRHDHTLKTSRGWQLVRRDHITYLWISPLGRKHLVTIGPVAPPLPAPIPRRQPADLRVAEQTGDDPPPSFQTLNRRGRPPTSTSPPKPVPAIQSDPPPF